MAGTVEQRDPAATPQFVEKAQKIASPRKLAAVLRRERFPTARLVPVPAAQCIAWRRVLKPEIYRQLLLAYTARPQTIDEDAHSIVGRGRLVGAFYAQRAACAA